MHSACLCTVIRARESTREQTQENEVSAAAGDASRVESVYGINIF